MYVQIPITEEEAWYLSKAAIQMGMDLGNYFYRVGLDYANAENKRLAGSSNTKVPYLRWKRR
jgi:hypothetical protein